MVINSGNYEFIGIRDRKSQTLYISDLIQPHSPPYGYFYGQIHIGLYVCAMQDVIKRAQQAKDMEEEQKKQNQSGSADPNRPSDKAADSNGAEKKSGNKSSNSRSADRASDTKGKRSSDTSDGGSNGRSKGDPCDNCSHALQEVNLSGSRQFHGTDSTHLPGNV